MTENCNCPKKEGMTSIETLSKEEILESTQEEIALEVSSDKYYLGVDVGSISTNLAIIDSQKNLVESVYIRTEGRPIQSIQHGVTLLKEMVGENFQISGVGAT